MLTPSLLILVTTVLTTMVLAEIRRATLIGSAEGLRTATPVTTNLVRQPYAVNKILRRNRHQQYRQLSACGQCVPSYLKETFTLGAIGFYLAVLKNHIQRANFGNPEIP